MTGLQQVNAVWYQVSEAIKIRQSKNVLKIRDCNPYMWEWKWWKSLIYSNVLMTNNKNDDNYDNNADDGNNSMTV